MGRKSILLLEQNVKIAKTLEAAFRRSGFVFTVLPVDRDVISYLSKRPVDVVLINLRQMGSGARSVCARIRSEPRFKRFPLIILYGKSVKQSRFELMKIGADDFIEMPFMPVDVVSLVAYRLRPLEAFLGDEKALSELEAGEAVRKPTLPPVAPKGDLELSPLTSLLPRIHLYRESGILTLIIKKETHFIYIDMGNVVFAESRSRKFDFGNFMAQNRAGTGSAKELVAARMQAGGPGSDPRAYRMILRDTGLMSTDVFQWWMEMHVVELIAELFPKFLGTYQWENLPFPEYIRELGLEPIHTPKVVMEGVRRIRKWWHHRDMLPREETVPVLLPDFDVQASRCGLTIFEQNALKVVNGKRTLRQIREICHQVFPVIDNFLYACQQLQMVEFKEDISKLEPDEIDLDVQIMEEEPPVEVSTQAPVTADTVVARKRTSPKIQIPGKTRDTLRLEKPEVKPEAGRISATPTPPPQPVPAPAPKPEPPPVAEKTPDVIEWTAGNFEEHPVVEVFHLCLDRSFSGCVEFTRGDISKRVYWRRGKITAAVSGDVSERLDNFLFQRGMINEDQLKDLQSLPDDRAGSPNEILRRHYLSLEQIFMVVKEQLEAIVKNLFTWREGTFQFFPDTRPPRDVIPMDVPPAGLIISGLREIEDWSHLESRLPEDGDRVELVADKTNHTGLNLSHLELRIFNVLQEPLPVSEVLKRIGLDPEKTRRSLYAMELGGLVKRSGRGRL